MPRRVVLARQLSTTTRRAAELEMVAAACTGRAATWRAALTLRHADSGWQRYADAWPGARGDLPWT